MSLRSFSPTLHSELSYTTVRNVFEKVEAHLVSMPIRRFSDAYSDYLTGQFVLVEIQTDEGVGSSAH